MVKVKDLVSKESIKALNATASVSQAAALMSANKISCVLVREQERLVGIFTDRDLKNRVVTKRLDYENTPLSKVMTRSVETVDMQDDLEDCLISLKAKGCHHLPVLQNGKVVAVLSKNKIMNCILKDITTDRNSLKQYIMGTQMGE